MMVFDALLSGGSGGGADNAWKPETIRNVMLGGSALSAGGTLLTGMFNSRIARNQAMVSEWQARDALDRGREQETQHRLAVRRLMGAQRSAFAAQNVDVNFGSAVDVQADTARQGARDAIIMRNNAAREAWAYRTQASNQRATAQQTFAQGVASGGSTLLTGTARAQQVFNRIR